LKKGPRMPETAVIVVIVMVGKCSGRIAMRIASPVIFRDTAETRGPVLLRRFHTFIVTINSKVYTPSKYTTSFSLINILSPSDKYNVWLQITNTQTYNIIYRRIMPLMCKITVHISFGTELFKNSTNRNKKLNCWFHNKVKCKFMRTTKDSHHNLYHWKHILKYFFNHNLAAN
jgi:hypothetical protein